MHKQWIYTYQFYTRHQDHHQAIFNANNGTITLVTCRVRVLVAIAAAVAAAAVIAVATTAITASLGAWEKRWLLPGRCSWDGDRNTTRNTLIDHHAAITARPVQKLLPNYPSNCPFVCCHFSSSVRDLLPDIPPSRQKQQRREMTFVTRSRARCCRFPLLSWNVTEVALISHVCPSW